MTAPVVLTCPVGHPGGPGQSFCPICGRDNITVAAPVVEEPVVEEPAEVPAQAVAPVEEVISGPAPHYAPDRTHFWDGTQWLPGHLGPQ